MIREVQLTDEEYQTTTKLLHEVDSMKASIIDIVEPLLESISSRRNDENTRLTTKLERVRQYCERTAANYAGGTAGTAIDVLAILDKE